MTIIAGGPGYRWAGKNIRILDGNEISLPRSDSFIVVAYITEPNKKYIIKLLARNKSGNGKIKITVPGTDIACGLYIKSKEEKEYKINTYSDKSGSEIRINSDGSSGNIRIKAISCEEVIEENTKDTLLKKLKEKEIKRAEELGRLYAANNREEQARILYARRVAIGEEMAVPVKFGGKGYKWKGYAIKTTYKFNATCATLPRKDSAVMLPITIEPGMKYKVTVFAAADKTPAKVLVNFFGGSKADFAHLPMVIMSNKIKSYEVETTIPKFPKNLPMYLRVFAPGVKQSNIYIKHVECVQIADPDKVEKHVAIQNKVRKRDNKKIQPQILPVPQWKPTKEKIEELLIMKFKPYEEYRKKLSERAQQVMINSASQVPKVSIITPTRDGADLLRLCYDALNKNTGYPNWEWIVGDSISDDDTEEFMKSVAEKDPRVIFVQRGTNEGSFSSINNELVKHATGEYYLFLNNDTEPQLLWLYEMMSKIHRHPEIGIVGARLMHGEKRVQHCGIMFVPQGPINVSKPVLKALGGEAFVSQDRFYQAVTGACLLIRKTDFDKVDKFDPIYHFCYEDVDLCLKVKYRLNKKILYAANAIIQHAESSTQKKHGTGGDKQRKGIEVFKARWMRKVDIDFSKFTLNKGKDIYPKDISFVTCVNNSLQYTNYVVGSLFMNNTKRNYEVVPVMNHSNPYSAAQALNIGIDKSKSAVVVLCHQDVAFYDDWIELLFKRISEINSVNKKWGVLGTAGIDTKDRSVGVVHNAKGSIQWRHNANSTFYPVQTVDEHCMIIQKRYGLKCDASTFTGFHCYGPDLSLSALAKGLTNYGILCPLIHDSSGSGSLVSGQADFMKYLNALANKWRAKFHHIRTTTSVINKRQVKTFIKFKGQK